MATYTVNVSSGNLHLRKTPNGTIISKYPKGTKVKFTGQTSNNWISVEVGGTSGWMYKPYLKADTTPKDSTKDVKTKQKEDKKNKNNNKDDYSNLTSGLFSISNDYEGVGYDVDKLLIDNIVGIYGMPYQFLPTVDLRVRTSNSKSFGATNQDGIGRKYGEKIVSRMPLVLFTPGEPKYLEKYTNKEKNAVLQALLDRGYNDYKSDINAIIGKNNPGRYYTFEFNYLDYFKQYVEPMLWTCAKFLGIENEEVKIGSVTSKLKNFPWRKATNDKLAGYLNSREFIPFYVDSEDSISESFSTSTTHSQLSSVTDELTAITKEVMFITGNYTNKAVGIEDMTEYGNVEKALDELTGKTPFKNSKLIDSLKDAATTIAAGGKIYFPEIWEDTTFTKTYNINMKFRTPDGDKLSWFLNICVPLIHIIALAAPRELKNPNLYRSPFLVRAYCKGIFNCDMGIITGLNITKGKAGSWTLDGLPTEVDVSIDLKDLYSVFSMSEGGDSSGGKIANIAKFVRNIGMIDYLASTCGLNINKPEIQRSIDLYILLQKNRLKNLVDIGNRFETFAQAMDNYVRKLYESGVIGK